MGKELFGRRKAAMVLGTIGLVAAGGAGVAMASGDDDGADRPIEGIALEKATDAALAETGGGTVTGTEVGDEESMYEVEVTLDDGSQVDVQLDADFQVVDSERDGDEDESPGSDD